MLEIYNKASYKCSKAITTTYSTSFTLGILGLKKFREAIYSLYGFVRLADEIVDSFHAFDKEQMIIAFERNVYEAIEEKISTNPILHAFQCTVNKHKIDKHLIEAFMKSMKMDLNIIEFQNKEEYEKYIYGSAEVVGLMSLKVFCEGDIIKYNDLLPSARRLGAAFQKVNFLRDMKSDKEERGRVYFPHVEYENFSETQKRTIELEIQEDFDAALYGVKNLNPKARLGVFLAYIYFKKLFDKIKKTPANVLQSKRIRINNFHKLTLFFRCYLLDKFNIIK